MVTSPRTVQIAGADDSSFDEARRFVDNFFGNERPRFCAAERAWVPPTDVYETHDAVVVKMEVPGIREENIQVQVNDNFLVIRGRRDDEDNVGRENFHLMEIRYGMFERVFRLPTNMRVPAVTALLANGFLVVTLPKDSALHNLSITIEY